MTSYEDVENEFLAELMSVEATSDEAAAIVKNLRVLTECKPAPAPLPEPKQSWFDRHSDALIKGGASLLGVAMIIGGEKLAEHIYNTKAWSTLPK